jgi:HK97 family phage major capsid protein
VSKSVTLREEAIAAFKAADALVVDDSGPKAEDKERFDAFMAEGTEKMNAFRQAAADEGQVITLRDTLASVAGAVRGSGPVPFSRIQVPGPGAGQTLGAAFVASKEYADLVASGNLQSDRSSFRSTPFQAAATDVIHSTPSTGPGSALVTPEYLPGIVPLPQRDLTVRALFGAGTTQSDTITYAQQNAFDKASGSLAVKQSTSPTDAGGLKKQSSIAWERLTSPVETIATWMAATRNQLADAGQIRALIDNALRLMLGLEEEDQLLNGNGTSPNLSGIYDQAIQTSDVTGLTSDGEPNIDGIRNAARLVKVGLSRLTADAIVMNPTDSMYLDLTVDGESRYRVGDPFSQAVGAGPRPIWGLRRVESEAIAEGHALIGAFNAGATVLERQGITILTADQHADFFVRNLVVVLAEERLGFPVYFPSAFVDLTLDTWSNVIGS